MKRLPGPEYRFGFVERFAPEEREHLTRTVAAMQAAGATWLRLPVLEAEYRARADWHDWLLPTLGGGFELLPSIAAAEGGIIEPLVSRHGSHFRILECTLPPGLPPSDRGRASLLEAVRAGVASARRLGCEIVLGGVPLLDAGWLELIGEAGLFDQIRAVGVRWYPGTWDDPRHGRPDHPQPWRAFRTALERYNRGAEIWLTETGYSTWRHDEAAQAARFRAALEAPASRMYWSVWRDVAPASRGEGVVDPRAFHLGVSDWQGRPKLLRRLLESGNLPTAGSEQALARPAIRLGAEPAVVFGGAGFIGSNLADALLSDGREVVLFDNLSRPGVERNLAWLAERHGKRLHPILADIRDPDAVGEAVRGAGAVFHLAAQVAVTSSLVDPRHDFAVNAVGTLNVLEAVRLHAAAAPVVFASTNKVYGALADVPVVDAADSTLPQDEGLRAYGIGEQRPLDFCTPYGCSKGVADQYVLDYAHSFRLRTAVLRMSCIYGPRQFGNEDQGWIAHFLIRALRNQPITLFGNGKQVRDVLHVVDAVRAYRGVLDHIDRLSGRAFNLGGGPGNAVSLQVVLAEIGSLLGRPVEVRHEGWRSGDQPYFVADTRSLHEAIGWSPQIGWREGLRHLADWLHGDLGCSETLEAVSGRRRLA